MDDDFDKWWKSLSKEAQNTIRSVLTIVAVIALGVGVILWHNHTAKIPQKITQPPSQSQPTLPSYTASNVVSAINSIRESQGLNALNESSMLDSAAKARSDEMVAQNIRDNTTGDTQTLITDAGYQPDGWQLQSAYGLTSAQAVATTLTGDQGFGLSSVYSDIGVGVSLYNNSTQLLVAVFLSNPQPVATYSQTYWYCWDTGDPAPHHLGYPVSGDHFCSDQELHDAGIAGY